MALTYRTDDPDRWGAGKGGDLTAQEIDRNMWDLDQRIQAIEDTITAGIAGVGISNIEQIGNTFKIFMTNGDSYGPFVLPTAMFTFRGEYQAGTAYRKLDLITVKQQGLFLINYNHVAGPTFDPDQVDVDTANAVYVKVFGEDTYIMDISFGWPGKPGQGVEAETDFMEYLFIRSATISATFAESQAKLQQVASATMVMKIKKNGTQIGTLTFAPGVFVGVLAWTDATTDKSFVAGDLLSFQRPDNLDVSAARLAVTIAAKNLEG